MAAPALITDVLQRFGEVRVRVFGTSMLPAIGPRDVLLVRRCSMERVAVGDVVLSVVGERLFAHRVTQIGANAPRRYLITKGDTHERADPPVFQHQLLGKVVSVSRGLVPCVCARASGEASFPRCAGALTWRVAADAPSMTKLSASENADLLQLRRSSTPR